MIATESSNFKHTTLEHYPINQVGITLLDESPGFTGIYLRDENGGLWPVRTVSKIPIEHHDSVCKSWMSREGSQDNRKKPKCPICKNNFDENCGTVYCSSLHGICGSCGEPRPQCKCQISIFQNNDNTL